MLPLCTLQLAQRVPPGWSRGIAHLAHQRRRRPPAQRVASSREAGMSSAKGVDRRKHDGLSQKKTAPGRTTRHGLKAQQLLMAVLSRMRSVLRLESAGEGCRFASRIDRAGVPLWRSRRASSSIADPRTWSPSPLRLSPMPSSRLSFDRTSHGPPPDDLRVRSVAFPRQHLPGSGRWCQDAHLLPWGVVATHSSGAPIQLGIDDPSWGSLAPAPARARVRRRMSATACRWTRVHGPRVRPSPGDYRARATPPARHPRGDDVPSRHGWRTPRGTASPSPGWQSR